MSYSTLVAIETCALQWSLSRGKYAEVWNRWGYPSRLHTGTVSGQVVHRALERIARGLSVSSGDLSTSQRLLAVLKQLGGYSQLLAKEIQVVVERSSDNPRVSTSDRDLSEELMRRLPVMRQQLQLLSSRLTVKETKGRKLTAASTVPEQGRALRDGLNAEVELRDAAGIWRGTADLICVSETGAEIIDFKTGSQGEEHALQLRLYAVLWDADREANPKRLPVTKLTIVYEGREESIEVPSEAELVSLSEQLNERARRAAAEVSSMPPPLKPDPGVCCLCLVRQLCETYWTETIQTAVASDKARPERIDAEVRFHEKYAESAWRASVVVGGSLRPGSSVLVRCQRDSEALARSINGLIQGRILGAQVVRGAEELGDLPVLNLTRFSEVFAIEKKS